MPGGGLFFSIHFFNTHFRIEMFPMDTVIFSGRLVKTCRLDVFRRRDEWFRWKNLAKTFGYFFFGLVLLALVICAMISRPAR